MEKATRDRRPVQVTEESDQVKRSLAVSRQKCVPTVQKSGDYAEAGVDRSSGSPRPLAAAMLLKSQSYRPPVGEH